MPAVSPPFADAKVEEVFRALPSRVRGKLLALRALIFEVAAETDGVGAVLETLKWGEPAYLTPETKSGSTIRINARKGNANEYAMFFHCQTTLIDSFRSQFPHDFVFDGNRALVFNVSAPIATDKLKFCIADALSYHLTSRRPRT